LRGLSIKILLAVLLAAAGGCGLLPRPAPPAKTVFVNFPQLSRLHPGAKALGEMDQEITALAKLAGVELTLPEIPVPAPASLPAPPSAGPGGEEKKAFLSQAQQAGETHLTALRQELAETRARKGAQRRSELLVGLKQVMKVAQAQGKEAQGKQEAEVYARHRRALFNLRANLLLQNLPGEEKTRLTAQLQAEEAAQAGEITAVRAAAQQKLAQFQQDQMQEIEKLLAAYERELADQDEALTAARKAKMQQELETAAARLTEQAKTDRPVSPQPTPAELAQAVAAQKKQAGALVGESRRELLNKLIELRQARARLGQSLGEEVAAALTEIGAEQNLRIVYDPQEAKNRPDYTLQTAEWLKQYWQTD